MSDPKDQEIPPVPDPAKIREMLEMEMPNAKTGTNVILPEDVGAEVAKAFGENPSVQEEQKKIDIPIAAQFDTETPNLSKTAMTWMLAVQGIGDVEVEDHDKTLYWKAMLCDAPFELDIHMGEHGPTPIVLKIRSISSFIEQVISAAMVIDTKEGIATRLEAAATQMLHYCVMSQVISINGAPFGIASYFDTCSTNIAEAAAELRKKTQEVMWKTNSARRQLLHQAVTIFAMKDKICADALANNERNKSFWRPRDAA